MKREIRTLLKERARAIAQEPQPERDSTKVIDVITFSLGVESYGIESSFVREVYPLKDYTILPCVPSFIAGIINVRGQILPVVNIKKFFNLPETGLGELNRVLILSNESMEFGILADLVESTQRVKVEDIHSVPLTVTGIGVDYLMGVTSDNLIILNAGNILSDKKIIVNDEVN
jgi:purine-binding chemotaxis protein CheW